jgi:hypothetical protein
LTSLFIRNHAVTVIAGLHKGKNGTLLPIIQQPFDGSTYHVMLETTRAASAHAIKGDYLQFNRKSA